jgi:hypothetical protein
MTMHSRGQRQIQSKTYKRNNTGYKSKTESINTTPSTIHCLNFSIVYILKYFLFLHTLNLVP